MKRLIILIAFSLQCIASIEAATCTATTGLWSNPGTWSCGYVPTAGDDVVIPNGVTVTTLPASTISNFRTITVATGGTLDITGDLQFPFGAFANTVDVYGTLKVSNDLVYNRSKANVVTIRSNAVATIGRDISVTSSAVGTSFVTEIGAEVYVGRNVTYSSATAFSITNNGYIEVTTDLTGNNATFTNTSTGTIVVHGNIAGGTSKLTLDNFGIITVDHSVTLVQTQFTNHTNAMFVVFGDITFDNGSTYTNSGLVQCNSFIYNASAGSFINTSGTLITLVKYDIPTWSGCPCQYDPTGMGQFYYGSVNATGWCGGGVTCASFLSTHGNVYNPGKMLWLKSDFIGYGALSDGDKIKRWFDLSNNFGFYMSESNLSYQPAYKDNSTENVNFNPVMNFSGGEKHLDLDANYLYAASGKGGVSMFSVAIPSASTTGNRMIVDFGNQTNNGYGLGYSAQDAFAYTSTQTTPIALGGKINTLSSHGGGTQPMLISETITFATSQTISLNGTDKDVQPITLGQLTSSEIAFNPTPTGTAGPFTVGALSQTPSSSASDFEGDIAEIMVYAKNLSTSEKEAVQSYLALKYGITLPHDYRSSNGTSVWVTDAKYKYDIAGLSREDIHFLHQRKSHSINSGSELTISTAAINNSQYNQKSVTTDIAANTSFYIWAHNGASLTSGRRVYKSVATNFAQAVYLQFAVSGLTSTPKLMIADDALFTTNLKSVTGSYDGTYLTYNTSSDLTLLAGTKYFKLDLPVKAPGGVTDELSLWLKADYGVENSGTSATDGQTVTTWKDASGVRGNNATSTTGTEPSFISNSTNNINYNPAVSFNGTSSALTFGNDYVYSPTSGLSILGIAKPTVSTGKTSQFLVDFGQNSTAGYGFTYGYENISSYTATAANGLSLAATHPNLGTTSIAGFKADFSGKTQYLYLNGTTFNSQTAGTYVAALADAQINQGATAAAAAGPVTIGRQSCTTNLTSDNNRYYLGSLPEIAVWTKSISDAERQRIDSYYAIKYGLTIPKDYVCSDGTTIIWNRTSNITYHHGVAGILRDDVSGLLQKQSKSNSDIIAIGLGTIATSNTANAGTISTDKMALVWGHNNGSLIANVTTDKPASIAAKMGRVWKVTETGGDLGTIQIAVTISGGSGVASDYSLLVDVNHDGLFASETPIACSSVSGSTYYFSCNLANGDLFTIGMPALPTTTQVPGIGINTTVIHPSAHLHVQSTGKGVLLPSMTNAEMLAITSPPNGLIIYNTTYNRYMFNAGTPSSIQWKVVGSLITQTSYEMAETTGNFLGEMRYNTTTNTVWYWDGSYWYELQ